MRIPIYQVSAFSSTSFNGNPASVCVLKHWLPDPLMQAIAFENNHPETAFLIERGDAYDLRWFSPACEVTLCGHATLAAAHVVREYLRPSCEVVTFHSPSGPLHVSRVGDLWKLDLPELPFEPMVPPARIADALSVDSQQCFSSLDLMVVLRDEAELEAVSPRLEIIATLEGRGLVVTAPARDCDFASRFFAPKLLIPDDPITGSAHCTLVPYWAKRLGKNDLSAKQLSSRNGAAHLIRIDCAYRRPRVHLIGAATSYLEGHITVPEPA